MATPPRSVLGAGSFLSRPPDPARFNNWREYATALSAFTADSSKVREGVQPEAIQLIHIDTTGQLARTVADGLMVYDPVRRGVMVSIDGEWLPLYAGIAYGGMRGPETPVAGATITTVWQTVVAFSEVLPTVDMEFSAATDTMTFLRPGLYQVNVYLSLLHNSTAASRELDFRLRNTITNVTTRGVSVATGQNDRTTSYTQSVQVLVNEDILEQPYVLEVSAPLGQYSVVEYRGVSIQAARLNYAF